MNGLIRVFPHRTKATPTDHLAFVGYPPLIHNLDPASPVFVSCAFTWDLPRAEELAEAWGRQFKRVELGGPAFGQPAGDFEPGLFLGTGYTITSRGCPNACPHCLVPKRQGPLVELPIRDGWIIQDDNLLACSEQHVRAVFDMLARQPRAADLRGGLEADRLLPWHVDLLADARIDTVWFAYDNPADYDALVAAGKLLRAIGLKLRTTRCYVLIGHPGDTVAQAERRLWQTVDAGFLPFAMLYRDEADTPHCRAWRDLQRLWSRPAATMTLIGRTRPMAGQVALF